MIDVGECTGWGDLFPLPEWDGVYWAREDTDCTLQLAGYRFKRQVMHHPDRPHHGWSGIRWWSKPVNDAAHAEALKMATAIGVPFFEAKIDLRRTHGVKWRRIQ